MNHLSRELLITIQADVIRIVEVEKKTNGLPNPLRSALILLEPEVSDLELSGLIKDTLNSAGISLHRATLVVRRQDLIVRPDEVPEAITLKPTGYAAAAIGRNLPLDSAGEIAGGCIPLSSSQAGKVHCLNVGARAVVIEPYISLLTKAGLAVTRVIPATIGTIQALQTIIPDEPHAIGLRIESSGAELIEISAGIVANSWWLANTNQFNWGKTLTENSGLICNQIALLLSRDPAELPNLYLFNDLPKNLDSKFKELPTWIKEPIPHFEPNRGLRLSNLGREWAFLIAAAFSPEAADMRTSQMLVQEEKRNQKRIYVLAAKISIAVILLGIGIVWLTGRFYQNELDQVNLRYNLIASESNKLAKTEVKTQAIETKLATWGQVLSKPPAWDEVIAGLESVLPPGVSCKSLKLDANRGCVLVGTALDETFVTDFSQRIAGLREISKAGVQYIRNSGNSHGVEFAIGFSVKSGGNRPEIKK